MFCLDVEYRYNPEPAPVEYRYNPQPAPVVQPSYIGLFICLSQQIYDQRYTAFSSVLEPVRGTYCAAGNLYCSDSNHGISLVTLYGEQNTQIYDDLKQCNSVNNYNDRSNYVVRLYDNNAYTVHVELYCVQQDYRDSYNQNQCNLPHYLDAWVDFNNDGIFDESREQVHSSSWYEDSNRATEYDMKVTIPQIDGQNRLDGQHRMRIVLTSDERNRKPCQNSGYGEVRDYTIQIIPRSSY